jgi:glucan phosphoethanolaminetransferase (alkaline phosphatase superfamily)
MKTSKYYSLNFKKRPFQIFALTAIVLFAFSFFSTNKSTGININDTYVVISSDVIYRVLAAVLLLIWLLYVFIKKRLLSKKLIWAHALATILPILAAIISFHINTQLTGTSHYKSPTADTDQWAVYSLLLFIAVSAQFVLILNIAGGLVKRLTKKRGRIMIHDPH